MKDRVNAQKILDGSDLIKKKKSEMEHQKVWVPDPVEGFVLGVIQDISSDEATVMTVKDRKTVKVSYDSIYPSGELINRDFEDNCSLMYLNEGSLLNNLRIRYEKDQIYTYVANILIAINPYFDISNLYSSSFIEKYQGKSLGLLPPHLFALADKSLRDLKVLKQNQSIIVSGESGSGKTESTKYVLRYLCSNQHTKGSANKSDQTGRIENLILEANPVLEAFANAKTQRNNNSSRFGKFIEIHFDHKIHIVGGHISHYLLEKSRIITQSREERNYHIFYQLIAGLSKKDLDKLHLTKPEDYNYLRNGCTRYFGETAQYTDKTRCSKEQLQKGSIKDPIVNDLKNFKGLEKAFANFGVDEELKFSIFRIVAGVLHLGNIDFEEDPQDTRGGCRIAASAEDSLRLAASLIKIEPTSLRQCLLTRIMQTSKGNVKGTVYLVPLKQAECRNARDALSKTLYSRLFDYIVGDIINKSLPFFESSYYIGALDIAGFEFFETNCFEQFNINYCNERLQQFFNERILKEEQRIYESECLQLKQIDFQDNTDCLQLIERPNTGILALLDEESKLPKSSPFHFTEQVHLSNKNHFNLQIPRKSDLKIYRNLRDDEGFIVRHFAGAVCYQTKHFLMKNNDALHNSLQCLMLESADELIKTLFTSGSPNSNAQNGKLQLCSVSMKFKQQLAELMEKLNSTGTHFIRCIKPNSNFAKHSFAGANVLSQLRCSGMKSVMELMHQGYPSRTSFAELYNMYEKYLPANLRRLEPRMFSKILFKAIGLNQNDYKFGLTKVFFKAGKFAEFDQLIKADPEHLRKLISKVQKFLIITRWKMSSWCALSVIKLKNKIKYRAEKIVQIQAHLRMCSAIVRYRPLVKGLQGLRKLLTINEDLLGKTGQLKDANERSQMESQLVRLKAELGQFQNVLRANQIPSENNKGIQQRYSLRREFVDQKLSEFRDQLDDMVGVFKRKMNKQAELDQMQKKLEEEQRKLEEEERKRAEEEEKRRKREEMEARRLKEEQEMNRRDELARQEQAMKQEQLVRREQTPAQYGGATASSSSGYRINHQPGAAGYFELTDDIISEDNLQRKRLEQEKLDHDLAMRLASEMDRKHLEQQFMQNMRSSSAHQPPPVANNVPPPLQVSSDHLINGLRNIQLKPGQELDLSKWKYSELRDVINTSCDLFLLECCKKEFHRRLKVYHQWKMRNNQMQGQTYEQRAPDSIMKSQNLHPTSNGVSANFNPSKEQRYFRVPFMKSNNLSGEKGFWYSHFDGSYIARQMEIHPNKQPLLLRAGVNDMQMCELSLEETRLTSKRGAEILADEFEAEWIKNGGEPWTDRSRK